MFSASNLLLCILILCNSKHQDNMHASGSSASVLRSQLDLIRDIISELELKILQRWCKWKVTLKMVGDLRNTNINYVYHVHIFVAQLFFRIWAQWCWELKEDGFLFFFYPSDIYMMFYTEDSWADLQRWFLPCFRCHTEPCSLFDVGRNQ